MNDLEKSRLELYNAALNYAEHFLGSADDDRMVSVIARLEQAAKEFSRLNGWQALAWWPECPWPQDVWTSTIEEAGKRLRHKIADDNTITAISGTLMRHGWRMAEKAITERLLEAGIMPPNL